MIPGVAVSVDADAVVVTAETSLHVVSSAPLRGGVTTTRTIVNLHVDKDFAHESLERLAATFVRRRRLSSPWTALATAAWTEDAQVASHADRGVAVVAVVTAGLSNAIAAGLTAPSAEVEAATDGVTARERTSETAPPASTINTIVIVDARVETAALVNAIITATEVKTSVLTTAGVRCGSGAIATGTSTDAVLVAATGRGRLCEFGGPISDLGWAVACAVRRAMEAGVREWQSKNSA
jgi:adenosylcobinamide amidohydrolase